MGTLTRRGAEVTVHMQVATFPSWSESSDMEVDVEFELEDGSTHTHTLVTCTQAAQCLGGSVQEFTVTLPASPTKVRVLFP